MNEKDVRKENQDEARQQEQRAQDEPTGAAGRRRPRSGEGMASVLTHLREQESQRVQDDPTVGPGSRD
ncbi:hypothetical protein [Ramlibacter sp. Leaf400]|uniref:hypothetical protein n=1 Tax=Ramlibacter sp. Leaf400 TaxID=1736365 RepID=UPI0006F90736|nr:hypothetical protein [Ramlibacter sp. Leaf400]KQT14331.1 hypothetical protein ASG30_01770 [Ramlibacter sp. Leaf400]